MGDDTLNELFTPVFSFRYQLFGSFGDGPDVAHLLNVLMMNSKANTWQISLANARDIPIRPAGE